MYGGDRRGTFHAELGEITREIVLLAAHVTEAVPQATEALLNNDRDAAQAVIDHDDVLDRLSVDIEERCYRVLATQQPVATDLRAIITALRMVGEIERSGDLVVNVCKTLCALHPVDLPPVVRGLVAEMGDQAAALFRVCMDAYVEGDAVLAGTLPRRDDRLDEVHVDFREAVVSWGEDGHVREAVQMALIGRFFERIGDHAVNIGQRVQYLIEGDLHSEGAST